MEGLGLGRLTVLAREGVTRVRLLGVARFAPGRVTGEVRAARGGVLTTEPVRIVLGVVLVTVEARVVPGRVRWIVALRVGAVRATVAVRVGAVRATVPVRTLRLEGRETVRAREGVRSTAGARP